MLCTTVVVLTASRNAVRAGYRQMTCRRSPTVVRRQPRGERRTLLAELFYMGRPSRAPGRADGGQIVGRGRLALQAWVPRTSCVAQLDGLEHLVLLDQELDRAWFLGACLERIRQDVLRVLAAVNRYQAAVRCDPGGVGRRSRQHAGDDRPVFFQSESQGVGQVDS